jgi:cytochrome c oxidase subunit II
MSMTIRHKAQGNSLCKKLARQNISERIKKNGLKKNKKRDVKMKSYFYIFGLLTVLFVAACTSATTDTGVDSEAAAGTETVTEPKGASVAVSSGEGEAPADTEISVPAPGADAESVVEAVVSQPEVKEFTMIAKQWEFDPGVIRVNKGDTVRLFVKSIDVAHGFALPDFGVNERLNPEQTVEVEFVADKTGTFTFFCSVQCGSGHSHMNGQLIVE